MPPFKGMEIGHSDLPHSSKHMVFFAREPTIQVSIVTEQKPMLHI